MEMGRESENKKYLIRQTNRFGQVDKLKKWVKPQW